MRRVSVMLTVAALVALLSAGAATVASDPAPADAAPCMIQGNFSEAWTPNPPTNKGVRRAGCWSVSKQTSGSQYRWVVRVQDTVDICVVDSGCNADGGMSRVEVQSPCSGCSNPWLIGPTDTNSADWSFSTYTSPWYHTVWNGPPNGWAFRFVGTTRFKNIFGQWANGEVYRSAPRSFN